MKITKITEFTFRLSNHSICWQKEGFWNLIKGPQVLLNGNPITFCWVLWKDLWQKMSHNSDFYWVYGNWRTGNVNKHMQIFILSATVLSCYLRVSSHFQPLICPVKILCTALTFKMHFTELAWCRMSLRMDFKFAAFFTAKSTYRLLYCGLYALSDFFNLTNFSLILLITESYLFL